MTELFVYKTKIKCIKDGKPSTFDKYKVSYQGYNFDLHFNSEDIKKQFEYEIKDFPVNLLVNDDDYYPRKKSFTRTDGTKGKKWVLFLINYQTYKQAEFTKRTIDDVISELEKEDKEGE